MESPFILKGSDSSKSFTLDGYGKQRVTQPRIQFSNKNIHTRNKNLWEEPITGAIVEHGAVTSGPFQVAETITGSVTGTIGIVTTVGAGSLIYDVNHDDFEVGETITGGTSGATATVTSVGTGSTIIHDRDSAAVILQVGQNNGDRTSRQTHVYVPHILGSTRLIYQSFLFDTEVTNVERNAGYGDLENGLFLNQDSVGLRFNRRTKTSGVVVDNFTERFGANGWNVDKFDGTGPSGHDLDVTKLKEFFISFTWEGAGTVMMGFLIDGIPFAAHEFRFAGVLDTVFMSTPSLPVFYEIKNTGDTASVNTLIEHGSVVLSEGGAELTGVGFSVSVDATPRAVTTEVPVLALRLKSTFGGGDNRKLGKFINGGIFAEDNAAHFEIKHIHDPSNITATWNDVSDGSAMEFSTDITTVTGNPEHKIEEGYAGSGQAGKGGIENTVKSDDLDQHRIITQNIDSDNSEIFTTHAISLVPQASNVFPHLSWIEVD